MKRTGADDRTRIGSGILICSGFALGLSVGWLALPAYFANGSGTLGDWASALAGLSAALVALYLGSAESRVRREELDNLSALTAASFLMPMGALSAECKGRLEELKKPDVPAGFVLALANRPLVSEDVRRNMEMLREKMQHIPLNLAVSIKRIEATSLAASAFGQQFYERINSRKVGALLPDQEREVIALGNQFRGMIEKVDVWVDEAIRELQHIALRPDLGGRRRGE